MTATRAAAAPPDRRGAEADTGAVRRWRAVRRAALAAGLVAALAAPAAVSAAPRRAAAQLKAASAPASELSQVASIPLPGGATVYRFQQRISGVKVLNGQAVVDDPAGAPPDLVADSSKPGIDAPPAARVEKPPRAPDRISRRGREACACPPVGEPGDCDPATAEGSSGASSSRPPGRWPTSRFSSTPSPAAWCIPATCSNTSATATRSSTTRIRWSSGTASSEACEATTRTGTPGS